MKKLIIAAAIVCAAAISQAAAVGWTCMNAADFKGGDYSIFVIGMNGVTGVDQIKAIVAAGGLDAASEYAFDSAMVASNGTATKNSASSGKSITWSGSGTDTYSAFIFVQDTAGENASFTDTKSITMADNSTSKTFAFNNQATAFTANKFEVAPEPTSGLLLLVGIAGLALRRRRV